MSIQEHLKTQALMQAHVFKCNNAHRPEASEFKYTSSADYILDRGEPMVGEESLTPAQLDYLLTVAPSGCEPKLCFRTALLLTLLADSDRIVYVEGFALSRSLPVPHAWVLLDGKLVDLTWSVRDEATKDFLDGLPAQEDLLDRILGVTPKGWKYFGVKFQRKMVREYFDEVDEVGSIIEDWERGFPLLKQERLGNSGVPDPDWWDNKTTFLNAREDSD